MVVPAETNAVPGLACSVSTVVDATETLIIVSTAGSMNSDLEVRREIRRLKTLESVGRPAIFWTCVTSISSSTN
jgi:hypothetical protein